MPKERTIMFYSLRRRNNFKKLLYVNAGMSWGLDVHELRSSANVSRHIFQNLPVTATTLLSRVWKYAGAYYKGMNTTTQNTWMEVDVMR
jgi:hypothetical protein